MRNFGIVAGCVWLAMVLSGCDPNDRSYFRGGVGTELYTVDTATATELQNVYLDLLCRQSRPNVGVVPSCSDETIGPAQWPIIVQAGMNDIDQRCDAYLSWLDQKKRETAGILAEIAAIRVAVDALTNPAIATSISPLGLAAIAAAFGLATSTFNNINSLLLQVDHTTVQTVVFFNRRKFRETVLELPINNKPMAVHALRSYLEICMPMTISANINSTVTVFQSAGAGALERQGPLVSPSTIGAPRVAVPMRVQTATQVIERRDTNRVFVPVAPVFAQFFEEKLSETEAERSLNALCLNKNPASTETDKVAFSRVLVRIYKSSGDTEAPTNAKITGKDREQILKQTDCGPAQNYFERKNFANTINDQAKRITAAGVVALVDMLNRSDAGGKIDPATALTGARQKIKAVRVDPNIAKQLTMPVPAEFEGQITPDLFTVLRNLPTK